MKRFIYPQDYPNHKQHPTNDFTKPLVGLSDVIIGSRRADCLIKLRFDGNTNGGVNGIQP